MKILCNCEICLFLTRTPGENVKMKILTVAFMLLCNFTHCNFRLSFAPISHYNDCPLKYINNVSHVHNRVVDVMFFYYRGY